MCIRCANLEDIGKCRLISFIIQTMWILRLNLYFFLLVNVSAMYLNHSTSDCIYTNGHLISEKNSGVLNDGITKLDQTTNGDIDNVSDRAISRSSRERKKRRKEQGLFEKILPMFIMPYLVQSAMLPMILMSMKAMLLKSMFIGKLALILVAINALRNRANVASDYNTKEDNTIIRQHYGYSGNEEYGAWVN